MRSAHAGAAASLVGFAAIAWWASAVGNVTADARTYRFSGRLEAGQRFERRFADSLRFVLEPADVSGWSIQILQHDTLADYAGIATPPFHGPNPTQIEAWHFRNQDNTGPSRGPCPGAEREFSFVTSRRDYQAAAAALHHGGYIEFPVAGGSYYYSRTRLTASVGIAEVKFAAKRRLICCRP